MNDKPVVRSRRARADFDLAVAHYLAEASEQIADAFTDAVNEAMGHISQLPASGSPRIGLELEYPGLRSWPIAGFPYIAFYVEHDDHIFLWRVMHNARDVPRSLSLED